ncbi:hypothetical protein BZG36_05122 [Bifiguratus adelaidae]|uniref:Uncharacterized protein n=1 Tax=Bifiguratus adelaidae TaxID=1938954 RepID=A0A261XUC3_9FUNG|nr:hypothetical protein BZG36_05122 [Bifiguratus adelaidae]
MSLSRTKLENILALWLNMWTIILYLLAITAAMFNIIYGSFSVIVVNVYISVLAAALIINEIKEAGFVQEHFKFLCTFAGRGLIFIFLGCITLQSRVLNIITTLLNITTGIFFFLISFTEATPRLACISFNWQIWKDFSAEGLDLPQVTKHARHSYVHERLTTTEPDELEPLPSPKLDPHANAGNKFMNERDLGLLPASKTKDPVPRSRTVDPSSFRFKWGRTPRRSQTPIV